MLEHNEGQRKSESWTLDTSQVRQLHLCLQRVAPHRRRRCESGR